MAVTIEATDKDGLEEDGEVEVILGAMGVAATPLDLEAGPRVDLPVVVEPDQPQDMAPQGDDNSFKICHMNCHFIIKIMLPKIYTMYQLTKSEFVVQA